MCPMCYAMAASGALLASVMYLPRKAKALLDKLRGKKCSKKKAKKRSSKKKK